MSRKILKVCWIFLIVAVFVGFEENFIAQKSFADENLPAARPRENTMQVNEKKQDPLPQTEREWKKLLTRLQYLVLREKSTERPFTGKYDDFFHEGTYTCAGCGNVIFSSEAKYDSGCGWPAFSEPADPNAVAERLDTSHGMVRTEIYCPHCGGHLGHVFTDGPAPGGLRYCINSAALKFQPEKQKPVDPNAPAKE